MDREKGRGRAGGRAGGREKSVESPLGFHGDGLPLSLMPSSRTYLLCLIVVVVYLVLL